MKNKIKVGQAYMYCEHVHLVTEIDKEFAIIKNHITKSIKKVPIEILKDCKRMYQDNY